MPRSTSGPKSSSGSAFGAAGMATPGMAGNCRRHVSMLTRVLSARIGIRLAGGGVPSVAHLFIASRLARKNIDVDTTLEKFCPWPRDGQLGLRIGEVLRTGPAVDTHRVGLREIVALRVGMHQGASTNPVFGRGLRMEHQRIGIRPLQDGVLLAGQMIGRPGIREWKAIGDV